MIIILHGGIFIARRLRAHWLFRDPRRCLRWLDLLFFANWRDTNVNFGNYNVLVKRGQMLTTIRQLMGLWETNAKTVYKTLRTFERDGMITRKTTRKMTLITVCNYEKYQSLSFADLDEEYSHSEPNFEEEKSDSGKQEGKQNKEYKNKKNRKKTLSGVEAQAPTHKEVFEDFFNAQIAVETFCMQSSIDIETCKKLALEVINDWELAGETHTTMRDGRKHLLNHIRRKLQEQKRQQNVIQKKSTKKEQRGVESRTGRDAEPNPLARARVHTATINNPDA